PASSVAARAGGRTEAPGGSSPAPDRGKVSSGVSGSLLDRLRVPSIAAARDGVNLTVSVPEAPGGRLRGGADGTKSGTSLDAATSRVSVPWLRTRTSNARLAPTNRLPNSRRSNRLA